jgi:hypothetical protein
VTAGRPGSDVTSSTPEGWPFCSQNIVRSMCKKGRKIVTTRPHLRPGEIVSERFLLPVLDFARLPTVRTQGPKLLSANWTALQPVTAIAVTASRLAQW